jgi:hypothetical protein
VPTLNGSCRLPSLEHVVLLTPEAVAERQSIERDAKVVVVERIDERVHGRVEPAEPDEERFERLIPPHARLRQERLRDVVNEEWQPARDERENYDAANEK